MGSPECSVIKFLSMVIISSITAMNNYGCDLLFVKAGKPVVLTKPPAFPPRGAVRGNRSWKYIAGEIVHAKI
jgi:hypothetical protein